MWQKDETLIYVPLTAALQESGHVGQALLVRAAGLVQAFRGVPWVVPWFSPLFGSWVEPAPPAELPDLR